MWLKNRFTASTLVELLVTIIISGIVLLAVVDGIEMFRKMFSNVSNVEIMGEPLHSHSIIVRLVDESDSVSYYEKSLLFFKSGCTRDTLFFGDDAILWCHTGIRSKLYHGYTRYDIILNEKGGADSLSVLYRKNRYRYGLCSE